jgi:hypothetical protein
MDIHMATRITGCGDAWANGIQDTGTTLALITTLFSAKLGEYTSLATNRGQITAGLVIGWRGRRD